MPDMLVRLYDLPCSDSLLANLKEQGISIQRAMAPDKMRVLSWIGEHSSPAAQGEADVCFARHPISLFLAVKEKQILGYACYHATALDFSVRPGCWTACRARVLERPSCCVPSTLSVMKAMPMQSSAGWDLPPSTRSASGRP